VRGEYTAIGARFSRPPATAFLLPQLISALPESRLRRATLAPFNKPQAGRNRTCPDLLTEHRMKIKQKPAVFAAEKITGDMLMLALQALIVGAAAAMLSGLVVAVLVALVA
jgi:hypothetical protein